MKRVMVALAAKAKEVPVDSKEVKKLRATLAKETKALEELQAGLDAQAEKVKAANLALKNAVKSIKISAVDKAPKGHHYLYYTFDTAGEFLRSVSISGVKKGFGKPYKTLTEAMKNRPKSLAQIYLVPDGTSDKPMDPTKKDPFVGKKICHFNKKEWVMKPYKRGPVGVRRVGVSKFGLKKK